MLIPQAGRYESVIYPKNFCLLFVLFSPELLYIGIDIKNRCLYSTPHFKTINAVLPIFYKTPRLQRCLASIFILVAKATKNLAKERASRRAASSPHYILLFHCRFLICLNFCMPQHVRFNTFSRCLHPYYYNPLKLPQYKHSVVCAKINHRTYGFFCRRES